MHRHPHLLHHLLENPHVITSINIKPTSNSTSCLLPPLVVSLTSTLTPPTPSHSPLWPVPCVGFRLIVDNLLTPILSNHYCCCCCLCLLYHYQHHNCCCCHRLHSFQFSSFSHLVFLWGERKLVFAIFIIISLFHFHHYIIIH